MKDGFYSIGQTLKTEECGVCKVTDVAQSTNGKVLIELTDNQLVTFWLEQEHIHLIED